MSEHIYVSLITRRSLFIDEEEKKIYNTRRKREREREREKKRKRMGKKGEKKKRSFSFVVVFFSDLK